ncbi:uncharacterized protein LOC127857434 [Dreissena polymorpha]|uniref:uncharacterized protein LOC127857434 n=1 Tax=Dreissena polymorpha TaxID=45954 RepID=UPI002264E26D|nr:uncharacterized protein LOC127857434 [Dreissena polymorpha]
MEAVIASYSDKMSTEISVFAMPFTYDHDIFCKISRCLSFIVTANYSFVLVTVAYDRYLMVCKPLKRITYGQRYATRACIGDYRNLFLLYSLYLTTNSTASKGKSASNSIDTDNFATYPKPLDERARSQSDGQLKATVPKQCTRSLVDLPGSMGPDSGRLVTGKESGHEKYKESFTYLQEENVFKTKENINGYCRAQLSVSITSAFGGSTDLSMLHLAAPHPQAKPVANLKELSLKRNTLIMRMVTFTFMMSYLPYLILVMLRYLDEDIPRKLPTNLKIVYQVFLKSYFLNSVLRPFIYIVMNERYRMKLLKLIRSWRRC